MRFGEEYITDADIAEKRALADIYRADPYLFEQVRTDAAEKLKEIPVMAKGVSASRGPNVPPWAIAAAGAAGVLLAGALAARKLRS